MKQGHNTKKGPGRFHIRNLLLKNTRGDKLNDDRDAKLSASQKQANAYAARYGSGSISKSKFKGFRKVRIMVPSGNHPSHPNQGMSVWERA